MKKNLLRASALLRGRTLLTSTDYREVLEDCTTADMVYMDPPYQGVCANRDSRYIEGVQHGEFVEALEVLNRRSIRFIVSYDGRLGERSYGETMPESLQLSHIEINVGRSSQATLLGRGDVTCESLFLSPAVSNNTKTLIHHRVSLGTLQPMLIEAQ